MWSVFERVKDWERDFHSDDVKVLQKWMVAVTVGSNTTAPYFP